MISLLCALSACSSSDDDEKDMQQPVITDQGITANPIDCQVYQRGETMPFHYVFTDDTELGNFNIEIHNNFDHHTHSTSSTECALADNARIDIPIPADIDPGDYHFMVRLTDKAGWQQLKAVAIKIAD